MNLNRAFLQNRTGFIECIVEPEGREFCRIRIRLNERELGQIVGNVQLMMEFAAQKEVKV